MDERSRAQGRPAVTLFVHDLAANPIVRAAPLAAALSLDYRVELVGLLLSGPAVYAPYRGRFDVRALPCAPNLPSVLAAAPRLARLATGDLLYACKPLLTTLLPAVLAARGTRRPLLLDVEDDERAASTLDAPARGPLGRLRRAVDPHALQARVAHPLTRRAAAVTVASERLRARYGGTLLRHGPDAHAFDPARPDLADRAALRARLGLPADRRLAVFAGRPRPHKGWEVLLDALQRPEAAAWDLVAAGPETAAHAVAARALGPRFHSLGTLPNEEMPALLAACDAAPAPQLDEPYARAQLPAKVLEAMAMALPVAATAVGDLPVILGGGARGWIVAPGDAAALARALAEIATRPDEAARRGTAARDWVVAEASVDAIRARLAPVVRDLLARRAA